MKEVFISMNGPNILTLISLNNIIRNNHCIRNII